MNEIVKDAIISYVVPCVVTIVSAYLAVLCTKIERKSSSKDESEIKIAKAKEIVLWVEKLYNACDGAEKKKIAMENLSQILNEKGIPISEIEIEGLIEDAVSTFNTVWAHRPEITKGDDTNAVG